MHRLGERIRTARQNAGLTLRQLGAATGVSASLLSQIENDRARPSVTTLYNLVGTLGLSLDEVLDKPSEDTATVLSSTSGIDMDAGLARLEAAEDQSTNNSNTPGGGPFLSSTVGSSGSN